MSGQINITTVFTALVCAWLLWLGLDHAFHYNPPTASDATQDPQSWVNYFNNSNYAATVWSVSLDFLIVTVVLGFLRRVDARSKAISYQTNTNALVAEVGKSHRHLTNFVESLSGGEMQDALAAVEPKQKLALDKTILRTIETDLLKLDDGLSTLSQRILDRPPELSNEKASEWVRNLREYQIKSFAVLQKFDDFIKELSSGNFKYSDVGAWQIALEEPLVRYVPNIVGESTFQSLDGEPGSFGSETAKAYSFQLMRVTLPIEPGVSDAIESWTSEEQSLHKEFWRLIDLKPRYFSKKKPTEDRILFLKNLLSYWGISRTVPNANREAIADFIFDDLRPSFVKLRNKSLTISKEELLSIKSDVEKVSARSQVLFNRSLHALPTRLLTTATPHLYIPETPHNREGIEKLWTFSGLSELPSDAHAYSALLSSFILVIRDKSPSNLFGDALRNELVDQLERVRVQDITLKIKVPESNEKWPMFLALRAVDKILFRLKYSS